MPVYLDLVILLNFAVDFLLLIGADRLCGHPPKAGRTALAAALGGLYGGVCLLPGFAFLGNLLWRLVSLILMALLAYGMSISALRRGGVFAFLCMALGGIAAGMGSGGIFGLVASAAVLCFLCMVGFRGRLFQQSYVPVELNHDGKKIRLTALQDTGNTLYDPVTGSPVLVVDARTAQKLTGLTPQQLKQPVETMRQLPGLRLIPYRAVGQDAGLLLGMKLTSVRIGDWQGSRIVAFAPAGLSQEGTYQALTGGAV